jgi:WD40 repeat protein
VVSRPRVGRIIHHMLREKGSTTEGDASLPWADLRVWDRNLAHIADLIDPLAESEWSRIAPSCGDKLFDRSLNIQDLWPLPGQQLVSRSDSHLTLWDLETYAHVASLGAGREVKGVLALSGDLFLTYSDKGELRLWDSRTGTQIGSSLPGADYTSLCPVVTCSASLLRFLPGDSGHVTSGPLLIGRAVPPILGHYCGQIRLWYDLHAWKLVRSGVPPEIVDRQSGQRGESWGRLACVTLDGHQGEILGMAQLPSGQLVSLSEDETVRLWDCRLPGNCEVIPAEQLPWRMPHVAAALARAGVKQWAEALINLIGPFDRERWLLPHKGDLLPILRHGHVAWSCGNVVGLRAACGADVQFNDLSAVWNADFLPRIESVSRDGTVAVTTPDNRLCFLKLYFGRHPWRMPRALLT